MSEHERLAEIEARRADCQTYNFGMRNADKLAKEDVPYLLALVNKQAVQIEAVRSVLSERYKLWAAICGNTCSKDIVGVDHDAIADEIAAALLSAIEDAE